MKKKIVNILKYALFTLLGITMFWLVYRGQDFENIWYTLRNNVDYRWVLLSVVFGILSHISRSLRWMIALEPLGEKPGKANTFIAVIMGYFMNLLLPRMGELARCAVLKKYENISFSKLLGTVVTERIVDLIMLMLISLSVLIFDFKRFVEFGNQNPIILEKLELILTSPIVWIAFLVFVAVLFFYLRWSAQKSGKNRIAGLLHGFAAGLKSVVSMKRYKAYIAHTVFIWLMYYLMLYSVFFSFDFTNNLGPLAGLTTFVFSSFAMLAPVQGGIGAWHFMAESALALYGVAVENGKIFALLAHSVTQIVIIFFGLISFILLPIVNRDNTKVVKPESD